MSARKRAASFSLMGLFDRFIAAVPRAAADLLAVRANRLR
jgi:hypothetical protein